MPERLKDLIVYALVFGVFMAFAAGRARLDQELVTKLRPQTATVETVLAETIPPTEGRQER